MAITAIEAQRVLVDMKVADYPRMTKDGRSQLHKDIHKQAYPEGLQKQMSFEEFIRKMKDGG